MLNRKKEDENFEGSNITKKQIKISDLNYNLYYTNNNSKLVNGVEDILRAKRYDWSYSS